MSAAGVRERPATSTARLTSYADVATFKAAAYHTLQESNILNTLLLSHLSELEAEDTLSGDVLLAVLDKFCSCTNSKDAVLVCPGQKGIGATLYISASPICKHTAQQIAAHLQSLSSINRITTTAANAELVAQALPADSWKLRHSMNIMVYQPALQSAAEGLDISINTSEQIHQQQQQLQGLQQQQQQEVQGQQQQQQQLRFGVCSHTSTKDTALVLNWCSSFLAQVFHMPTPPPLQQLSKMTLPRLRNGLYSVVRDNGQAVSMVSHVPTSESSTRITMLYTPEVCRGRGYGRFAVTQLCQQLQQQGYTDICLLADIDQPGVNRLYQACGFETVGELQMLARQDTVQHAAQ